MVFGAFDGLHPGHLNFFKQAKSYGDYLIVSVGTDKNVAKIKGKKPLFGQQDRLDLVASCKVVDLAVLGAEKDFYRDIAAHAPDIICLGYDQWAKDEEVRENLREVGLAKTVVFRLSAYKSGKAKSSILKKQSVDFNPY